jgi:phage tail-like protein
MKQLPVLNNDKTLVLEVNTEHRYIADVVRTSFPIRAARTYIKRHLGNRVQYRLVDIKRGEEEGCVREAEIISSDGGSRVFIQLVRTLPDGTPASFFTPKELVQSRISIVAEDGGKVPSIRANDVIVLLVPVQSYLRFLPGIYRANSSTMRRDVYQVSEREQRQLTSRDRVTTSRVNVEQADQFQRFLFLFQHMMTTVIDKIDSMPDVTDPLRVERKFLPWLSSWVNFPLDESLPLHMQRELVRRSIRLNRMRGTKEGLSEMIRILTSTPVVIEERKKPKPCVLGHMTLAGGKDVRSRFFRREPPPCYLFPTERHQMTFFILELEAKYLFLRRFGERAGDILQRIVQIVSQEMPAHVVFTIRYADDKG